MIIEQAREQAFSKRDLYVMLLFLSGCHAVVEDTLLFVPLGIPIWALLLLQSRRGDSPHSGCGAHLAASQLSAAAGERGVVVTFPSRHHLLPGGRRADG